MKMLTNLTYLTYLPVLTIYEKLKYPILTGACVAEETATVADGMHPTGMHSCCTSFHVNRFWTPEGANASANGSPLPFNWDNKGNLDPGAGRSSGAFSWIRHERVTIHRLIPMNIFDHRLNKFLDIIFRWFKFTLKPTYSITHGKLRLAIWDTSFWTFLVKFGHKGPWDIS